MKVNQYLDGILELYKSRMDLEMMKPSAKVEIDTKVASSSSQGKMSSDPKEILSNTNTVEPQPAAPESGNTKQTSSTNPPRPTPPVLVGRTPNKLPKVQETKIHPRDLQDRFIKELHADERYRLINDAKLRAMTQGTATYEEFRQIWMAAHLRPMEKQDKLENGAKSKVVWNSIAATGTIAGTRDITEQVTGNANDEKE